MMRLFQSTETVRLAFEKFGAIPVELEPLDCAANDAQELLSLRAGWDGDSAPSIEPELLKTAQDFLLKYALRIFNLFSIAIDTPDINPCPNGSIDISWRTKSARMLINIRKEKNETLAFFYGDLYENRMPIKGNVPVEPVEDHLACWMKNLT